MPGWVYAIGIEGRPDLIKVGRTDASPESRLAQLQTGQPDGLVLLRVWACSDSWAAEAAMHRALSSRRRRGEWFAVSLDQVVEAWARVSTGRCGWWTGLRWWAVRVHRRASRVVGRAATVTGVVTWVGLVVVVVSLVVSRG